VIRRYLGQKPVSVRLRFARKESGSLLLKQVCG
jgi:hypothetical protein